MNLDRFQEILSSHLYRYPLAQIEDFYKLCHQAALGSEHAVSDVQAARKWLEFEMEELEAWSPEKLIDPISADGQILRIHLRPYVDHFTDHEILLKAFIKTANEYPGSKVILKKYWQMVEMSSANGEITTPLERLSSFFLEMAAKGFPAMHHSTQYRSTYNPHYRVVAKSFLPPEVMNLR